MAEQTLAQLRAENEELKVKLATRNAVTFAVSKGGKGASGEMYEGKGGIMVRGFGRNPVTLYVEQWERLFEHVNELKAFIKEHRVEALAINAAYRARHSEE